MLELHVGHCIVPKIFGIQFKHIPHSFSHIRCTGSATRALHCPEQK